MATSVNSSFFISFIYFLFIYYFYLFIFIFIFFAGVKMQQPMTLIKKME